MRSNQWNVLGGIFFLISIYFLSWTLMAGTVTILSVKTIQDGAVWVVSRAYSIAYLVTFGFAVACWINAWLENRAGKRKQELAAERWIYEGGQVPEHMRMKGMPPYAPKKHPTSKDIEEIKRFKNKIKK